MKRKTVSVAHGSAGVWQPSSSDPGHLAGTTKSELEGQQQNQGNEKTAHEKTEEKIVIEYIKKQSLLEERHQSRRKSCAIAMEDEDDEELQEALKLSMQSI